MIESAMRLFVTRMGLLGLTSLLGVILFFVLSWLGLFRSSIPFLMYRGIAVALVAGASQALLIFQFARMSKWRNALDSFALCCSSTSLALSLNMIFLVVAPVTIDRSVTVFLLGQLAQSPDGLSEEDLTTRLAEEYVGRYRAVDRRMREQIASRNVVKSGNRYLLSDQGKRFIDVSTFIGRVFGADLRYIRGEIPTAPS